MTKIFSAGALALAVALVALAVNSLVIVDEREQVLLLRFGEPQAVYNGAAGLEAQETGRITVTNEPGLYFKAPFIDRVIAYERRIMEYDAQPLEVLSADREPLNVDAFLRYRIADPLNFLRSVRTIETARNRLDTQLQSSLRDVLAGVETQAIVSGERVQLMERIRNAVGANVRGLGVEVVDVRIRRADLPQTLSQSVYARMETERRQQAESIRATGNERALEIRAEADRQATVILAEANKKSEELRGQGDALRNEIFAEAYGLDPDFFAFYRSLIAYERSLKGGSTTLILSPDSDFFQYFRDFDGDGEG